MNHDVLINEGLNYDGRKRGARGIWRFDEKAKYRQLVKTLGNDAIAM